MARELAVAAVSMAPKRKTNRRDFLTGRSAVEAVSDLLPEGPAASAVGSESATRQAAPDPGVYLLQVGRRAMACEFQVFLNAGQHSGSTEAALEALDLVDTLEAQLSWFRDNSELTRINGLAARQPVLVEPRLFELLEEAVQLHDATAGAFDITSGPLSKLWGFHRREGKLPQESDIAHALHSVGTRWLHLDPAARTISFDRPGIEINLGAIGKGYALDRCAEVLRERGVTAFLIHGGQSSMSARGSRAGLADQECGWTVALRHPLRPEQRLGEIPLRDRALGTSGSGNQFFHFAGRRLGHVLDPRTGRPAEGLLSATVLAPTAAQADALSTAFFVLGVDRAREFCRHRPELSALFVLPGQHAGVVEIETIGLAESDWRHLEP